MDTGNYTCVAENQLGERHHRTVSLSVVHNQPPKIYDISLKRLDEDPTTAELICSATGQPPPKISWIKPMGLEEIGLIRLAEEEMSSTNDGDRDIETENDKSNDRQNNLRTIMTTIDNVSKTTVKYRATGLAKQYYGTFTCIAQNNYGESDADVRLEAIKSNNGNKPTKTIEKYLEIGFHQNQDAYLSCRHDNSQDPSNIYEWKYPDGRVHTLDDWRYSVIGVGVLRIRSVQVKHKGKYTCTVKRMRKDGNVDTYVTVNLLNVITEKTKY